MVGTLTLFKKWELQHDGLLVWKILPHTLPQDSATNCLNVSWGRRVGSCHQAEMAGALSSLEEGTTALQDGPAWS